MEGGGENLKSSNLIDLQILRGDGDVPRNDGRIVQTNSIVHSYPFCWRSDTPLIYKAVPNWFVNVEYMSLAPGSSLPITTYLKAALPDRAPSFFPSSLLLGFLLPSSYYRPSGWNLLGVRRQHHDPFLSSRTGKKGRGRDGVAVLLEEAGEEAGEKTRTRRKAREKRGRGRGGRRVGGGGDGGDGAPLRRVSEVFDCWFESGCMPYGQLHYPFENAEVRLVKIMLIDSDLSVQLFDKTFPADFIAEGLDQTRGWFYTLMVLRSDIHAIVMDFDRGGGDGDKVDTALFDKPAFKNVIVNGLVLASDGKKMSKRIVLMNSDKMFRLKNYPDPEDVINKYGADALRVYLINSPVVRSGHVENT
eukprot:765966-Hanusia_phi.AAC.13